MHEEVSLLRGPLHFHQSRIYQLPLPLGEGWGEGARLRVNPQSLTTLLSYPLLNVPPQP